MIMHLFALNVERDLRIGEKMKVVFVEIVHLMINNIGYFIKAVIIKFTAFFILKIRRLRC